MRYFLSYVESGIHASVMLSVQDGPNDPVKVSYEAGFDIGGDLQSPFGKQQGYYVEEDAASKAAYSSSMKVRHRTYEISEEEATKFFSLINQQRQKPKGEQRKGPLKEDETQTMLRGGKFQLLTSNCKVYALSVFNSLGIFEAKSLSNAFIQITRTKKSKTKTMDRNVISCPIKDKFIQEFEKFAQEMQSVLPQIKDKASFSTIADILEDDLKRLKEKSHKVAIEEELYEEYQSLFSTAKILIDATEDPALQDKLAQIDQQRQQAAKTLAEIKELDESHHLPFEWKTPPEVAKRVNLDSFSEEERAIYAIHHKGNQITDGLNDLSGMLEKSLKSTDLTDNARRDLLNLAAMVEDAKKALDESSQRLGNNHGKDTAKNLSAYMERQKELEEIVATLNQKISAFEPKNKKSTNNASIFFNNVANLFKKKSTILKENPQKVLAEKISALQKSSSVRPKGISFQYDKNKERAKAKTETLPDVPPAPSLDLKRKNTKG